MTYMSRKEKEGRRLKSLSPFTSIIPYIMVERSDSQNTINDSFDVSGAENLVKQLRAEGYESIGILHIMIAAYVRAISERPAVNRFIRGQRIYARNGIVVNIAIKRKMTLDCPDTVLKFRFKPTDTLIDVYKEVNSILLTTYDTPETSMDSTARIINYIPGLIKKFTIFFLKTLDYFGLLPRAIVNVSPFHGSMFITNMASLNIPPIRHHLYNFGNVPMFIAFGAKRTEYVFAEDGSRTKRRVIDMVLNMDERICDGFYYASALKIYKKYLTNPSLLLKAPERVIEDVR